MNARQRRTQKRQCQRAWPVDASVEVHRPGFRQHGMQGTVAVHYGKSHLEVTLADPLLGTRPQLFEIAHLRRL